MSTTTNWLIATALAVAIAASWHPDEPDTESPETVAAEQAQAQRVEKTSWMVDESVVWSPYR